MANVHFICRIQIIYLLSEQIRQNLKDAGEDHKKLLLALKFGGVPSINNLNAIYNFQVS